MASLLNNASLLLNPAGSIIAYEEDKIFSVIPSNGAGDFTFTGGDGGTRVNQQGYIEVTPANLILNSQEVALWATNAGPTINSNVATAPNGTLTADRINAAAAYASGVYQVFTSVSGQTYTLSVSIKNDSNATSLLIGNDANPGTGYVLFNPTTGAITSVAGSVTASSVINEGNGWYRVIITYVSTGTPNAFVIYSVTGTANSFFVWGAMANIGSTAKPYQPTTDRLNYPRITYQNGRGALLSEPQRTNLVLYSQQFDVSGWVQYNSATITPSASLSPDGTQNAYSLNAAVTGYSGIYRTFSGGTGIATVSGFFKKGTIDWVLLVNTAGNDGVAWFNLANGTIGTVDAGYSATIEPFKDGWYRCSMTGPSQNIAIWQIAGATSDNNPTPAYAGNIYIYGAQVEAGEFPTTYIPTTSATVTRPMDQFFKNDSSALTTTDWTFYMSGVNIGKNQNSSGNPIDAPNWSFDSGAGPYGPNSLHNYNNTVYYYDTVNGAANLGDIGSTTTKFAVTKNGTTFKLFRNGVLFSTNVLSLASNVWDSFRMYGAIDAEGQAFSNNPSTIGILPSVLSDANAQALTTIRSGSGGNISYYGPYTIHTFTGSATFTPSFTGPVEVLVVAGGGGAGGGGGGGGAGGLLYVSSVGVSQGTGYTITVGAGGVGYNSNTAGTNGSNSSAFGLNAIGGAGGSGMVNAQASLIGGSGGGGTINTTAGSGILGQGNNGGAGGQHSTQVWSVGGGGGGAGAVGQNFNGRGTDLPGNGGIGLPYSISGFSTYYAGGGGGGTQAGSQNGGTGGLGGGGNGGQGDPGSSVGFGQNGVSGLGGGGGASNEGGGVFGKAGNGGNGIIIVRYLT